MLPAGLRSMASTLAQLYAQTRTVLARVSVSVWRSLAWLPRRGWQFLKDEQERVRTIGGIIAALWGLWLYLDHIEDARIERTLKYVERLQSKELAAHASALNSYWTSLQGLGVLVISSDVEVRAQASSRIEAQGLEEDLSTMLDFYSEVGLCTRRSLCDAKTACAYFYGGAHAFYELYHPVIELWGLAARNDLLKEIRLFQTQCEPRPSRLTAALQYMGLRK
jgi:hypothetical protein